MGHLDEVTDPDIHDRVNREKNTDDAIKTFQERRDNNESDRHIRRNLEERGINPEKL